MRDRRTGLTCSTFGDMYGADASSTTYEMFRISSVLHNGFLAILILVSERFGIYLWQLTYRISVSHILPGWSLATNFEIKRPD